MNITIEIDGHPVRIEPIDDPTGHVAMIGLRLTGPRRYRGHLHGEFQAANGNRLGYCFPNVKASTALDGALCDHAQKAGFGGRGMAAVWLIEGEAGTDFTAAGMSGNASAS